MLGKFRAVFKGQQTPMTIVMGVVLVGLVAYLAPSAGRDQAPDRVVARVYGREVTYRDLYLAMDEMQKQFGRQANMDMLRPYIQGQALQRLVSERLTDELAERKGVVVTDVEVRDRLEQILRNAPGFTNPDGTLKPALEIDEQLQMNRERPMSLKILERDIRRSLLIQKMQNQAAVQVPVDEAWVALEHRIRNEKLDLDILALPVDPASVADPGDAALTAFMQPQGARFQVGPRRVIQYVSLDQAALGSSLNPDDAALKAAYESKKSAYAELHASHILLKVEDPARLPEVTKKIQEIRAKAVAGEDFGKLAVAFSEDDAAKADFGDVGWFTESKMTDKQFWQGVLPLKAGEVSQPVRTARGLHLIKLHGRRDKSFEDMKEEIRSQIVQDRFNSMAKDKLEQLRKRTGDKGDLSAAAKAMSLTATLSKPFLDEPASTIDGLLGSQVLVNEAFRLKVGEVSKVQRLSDRYVVLRVQEERPTAVPPMAEIRMKVLEAYRLEEARKVLKAKVDAALAKGDLASLGTVAQEKEKTIQSLGEVAQHQGLRKALLDAAEGKMTPAFWTPEGKLWVARVVARKAAEPLTFATRQTLVHELQQSVANKLLTAELMNLDAVGRARGGFSSLRGRFGGVWTDEDLAKPKAADAE